MDIKPFNEQLYRLRFQEYLREKDTKAEQKGNNLLLADVYVSHSPGYFRALPQDIGELKHPAIDEDAKQQVDAKELVPEILETAEKKNSDHGYRFILHDASYSPWETRRRMEDIVRKTKRSSSPCPHCTQENLCSKPFLRCGDRVQYSTRETQKQRWMAHRCSYDPAAAGSFIILVDNDALFRDFLKNACLLFLGYAEEKILQASNGKEVVALLSRCKVENKRCGLVVSCIGLPGMNGFELVNEIFYRNFDTNIILMNEKKEQVKKPEDYAGETELVPGKPLVRAVLNKPFHSEDFVKIVKTLRPNPFR
jgi:CheY-like chemotaxis protein